VRSHARHATILVLSLATAASAACSGQIGEPGGSGVTGGPGSTSAGRPGATGTAVGGGTDSQPGPFIAAPGGMLRLTQSQYRNSLRDLFGDWLTMPSDLEADLVEEGFSTVGSARVTTSSDGVEKYNTSALAVAAQAMSTTRRATFVGCTPASSADPCVNTFLRRFGRRVFRRPLLDEEVTRYAGVASSVATTYGGDVWKGLELTVAGLLQSPSFLYQSGIGEADPADASRLRRTPFEIAARLSYFLLDTTPDDALLDAADKGELRDVAHIQAQVDRLLALPGARETNRRFFGEHFNLDGLANMAKDKTLFPQDSPTLGDAMRTEIDMVVQDLSFDRPSDIRKLFDGRETFVNDELSSLYGLPAAGAGFHPVTLPADGARAGLLGFGGILALNAHVTITSPTRRGKFVRERLLCQIIPPPPANVDADLERNAMTGAPAATMRQRLEAHRDNAACRSCHQMMDPVGLGLENFDAVGAFRTTDRGLPIDTSGQLDAATFDGPRALATLLRNSPDTATCLARQVYRYATGHVETSGEDIVMAAITSAVQKRGYLWSALLAEVAASDGFRFLSPPSNEP
jgi:hypothetical protein